MNQPMRDQLPENNPAGSFETPPMHWHAFLGKCLLPLMAAVQLFQAAWIITGRIYYTAQVRAQVYAGIPGLRIADYALALCLLVSSGLLLAARGKLKGRKCRGVKLLHAACAVPALSQLGYAAARLIIAGLSPLNIPVIALVTGFGALLLVNISYYRKRRGLFE